MGRARPPVGRVHGDRHCWRPDLPKRGSDQGRANEKSPSHEILPSSAAEEKDAVSKEGAVVSEGSDPYVYIRDDLIADGMYIYTGDLFADFPPEKKENLAYPTLSWPFRKSANLGKHLLDMGGLITGISICGGYSEVTHTGTVAYRNTYDTFEILPEKMERLTQLLADEMNQKPMRHPAASCAAYLQHHSGLDLIKLLRKYQLIEKAAPSAYSPAPRRLPRAGRLAHGLFFRASASRTMAMMSRYRAITAS